MITAFIKRGFVLLTLVFTLSACQNLSRISIDSLLGEIRDPPLRRRTFREAKLRPPPSRRRGKTPLS